MFVIKMRHGGQSIWGLDFYITGHASDGTYTGSTDKKKATKFESREEAEGVIDVLKISKSSTVIEEGEIND